jgi:hypothetical protein
MTEDACHALWPGALRTSVGWPDASESLPARVGVADDARKTVPRRGSKTLTLHADR